MRIELTSTFTPLSVSEGTLQNVSRLSPIEVSSTMTKNTGIILNPGDFMQFKSSSAIYARAAWENAEPTEKVYLAHEPFKTAAEGGESSSIPTGTLVNYSASGSNPLGYLECNGVPVSRAMYPDLFDVIGTQYGPGDGSTTFNLPDLTNSAIMNGENDKTTITTPGAGTFTPPHDGWYKITIQGGGGGGAGSQISGTTFCFGGAGGGEGGTTKAYAKLAAGATYSYTVGVGGAAGTSNASGNPTNGSKGGASSIVINGTTYTAGGGYGGAWHGGSGGTGDINGAAGGGRNNVNGTYANMTISGGSGGGRGGGRGGAAGVNGGGGGGGNVGSSGSIDQPGAGGNGYITFKYIGTPTRVLIKAFDNQTPESALIDITQYAQELANKLNRDGYIPGAFNKKETFTSSGTFTAPVTGVYRITLQGGGGGGGGTTGWSGGGGGGSGAKIETYERLIAGVSYSYTVADMTSAASSSSDGDNGGDTSITVNSNDYIAGGGYGGYKGTATIMGIGGRGGKGTINGVLVSVGAPGGSPNIVSGGLGIASSIIHGGPGGGDGGGQTGFTSSYPYPAGVSTNGSFGGGGQGGSADGNTAAHTANRGGAGYISFEYYDPTV